MKNSARAFLFDLNGTMIDDMEFHVKAWYGILNDDLNANLDWEQVRHQMYGKNSELFVRVFGENRFTPEQMDHWSMEKERRYQEKFLPHLKLIHGLEPFLKTAKEKNIKLAIGSAAIPFNIDFVLDNLNIRSYFDAIVSADDVAVSKPHPETYTKAASLLQVPPENCIVFEDAPKGIEAAQNAGMKAIAITTMHNRNEFDKYDNIIAFIENYNDPFLETLFA
ncbi:MAG: HAD family phosphatase [Bacteroidetes bacterium]|nr:HAD family phosphatase [Bacteroidota bacterium]